MHAQHRLKSRIKPLVLPDRLAARRVKRGPGRGTVALLNPQHDLQREWGLAESELNGIYRRHIHAMSVVYDIGAGDGLTTLLYANLAYAPRPRLRARPAPPRPAAAQRRAQPGPGAGDQDRARALRFGGAIDPAWPVPTFVKVDVDGAELTVLDTLAPLLRHLPRWSSKLTARSSSARAFGACESSATARGSSRTRVGGRSGPNGGLSARTAGSSPRPRRPDPRRHAARTGDLTRDRDARIRTGDPRHPKAVRYQAAPRPGESEAG